MMFGFGGHWVFWQVASMWVGMIAFWGLLIWAAFALVTASSRQVTGPPQTPAENARQILDGRLARGEIDVEEYRRLRDAISSDSESLAGSAR